MDISLQMALDLLLRLTTAAALGAIISLHPVHWLRRLGAPDPDTVRAQILVAVAGAFMVIIVGDNMARAFGLVGIGSFIRYRTTLKNPKDTAVFFLLIALGMACGSKMYVLALLGGGFLFLLLFVLGIGRDSNPPAPAP